MTDFNKISYEEDWHQGLVAERLNQLVVELNDKVGSGLDITFSPNADWLQGRMYLPYNVLTDYLKGNHGYVDEFGGVGAYADWHQSNIQERVNIVGSLIESITTLLTWYNQTTGVIKCGAIIPCNEVIQCL